MLVTDVGDEKCWWHFEDVDGRFEILSPTWRFCHPHRDSVAYIWKLSPPVGHHYHNVTNITVVCHCHQPWSCYWIKMFLCEKNSIHKSKIIKTSEQILSGRCLSYSKILFTWLGNQNLNLINSVLGNFRCTIN